jgi:uncharacterized protein YqgC (DUF456 family)
VIPLDPALVAFALLLAGVVASFVPLVPGGLLSLAGLYVYWSQTGRPGALALAVLSGLCLVALVADWAGGAVAASLGGASRRTVLASVVVGLAATLVAGPVGLLVGVAGTVFAVEYRRDGDVEASARTALYATAGVLGSAAVQALVLAMVLVGFVLVR